MLKEYKKTSINNVIRGWQYKDCAILLVEFVLVWIFAKFSNNPPFNDISAIGILIVIFFVLVYAFYTTKKMLKKDLDKIIFETIDKSEEETKQIESLSSNQKDSLKDSFMKLKETEELVLSLKNELVSIDKAISETKEKTLNSLNCTNEEHITVKANIEKMFVIRHKMQTIAELILELSEFIQSISSTIGIVEDIAEQTNLLALNAAVEAARAGEHGKGFAVVAGEIRKLADESKQATTKITSLINDIQQTTNSTVIATEEGTKEIEIGIDLAHNIGTNIENLTSQINEIASGVNDIYLVSNKMTKETVETEKCVNDINSILLGASGTLDESNKKLENLNAISKNFKSAVVEE